MHDVGMRAIGTRLAATCRHATSTCREAWLAASPRGRAAVLFVLGMLSLGPVYPLANHVLVAARDRCLPRNFGVVRPGVLYRSGQLEPEHFAQVVRHHGIRTVVCLNPGQMPDEPARAAALGVRWLKLPMPGDGRGEPEYFRRFLEIVDDPAARPVLVHCSAGSHRTGVAVALFRRTREGWTRADALQEMDFYGFDNRSDTIAHVDQVLATLPARLRRPAWPPVALADREAEPADQEKRR